MNTDNVRHARPPAQEPDDRCRYCDAACSRSHKFCNQCGTSTTYFGVTGAELRTLDNLPPESLAMLCEVHGTDDPAVAVRRTLESVSSSRMAERITGETRPKQRMRALRALFKRARKVERRALFLPVVRPAPRARARNHRRRGAAGGARAPASASADGPDPGPSEPDPPVVVVGLAPLAPDQIHGIARRLAALLIRTRSIGGRS